MASPCGSTRVMAECGCGDPGRASSPVVRDRRSDPGELTVSGHPWTCLAGSCSSTCSTRAYGFVTGGSRRLARPDWVFQARVTNRPLATLRGFGWGTPSGGSGPPGAIVVGSAAAAHTVRPAGERPGADPVTLTDRDRWCLAGCLSTWLSRYRRTVLCWTAASPQPLAMPPMVLSATRKSRRAWPALDDPRNPTAEVRPPER